MKNCAALCFALFAMVVCVSAARADTHYVDSNSPKPGEPYTSAATAAHDIQAAVDAAAFGDTVQVAAGRYHISSRIVVGRAITVRGAGADKTIIDAGGKCKCVVLRGWAVLKGFTVTGGKAREGAGVQCGPGTTLAECIISNNTAERYGGGVCCRTGKSKSWPCLVRDCNIVGNRVTQYMHTDYPFGGGGVYAEGAATLRNCLIQDNESAQRGGGVWLHFGSAVAESCTIAGNRAKGLRKRNPNGPGSMEEGGGGAYCDFGGQLRNCLIYGNGADKIGGGVILSTGARAGNCTIAANTARLRGGGVLTMGPATIVNSILHGNTRGPNDEADDLYVSHYYHVDVHQLMLGKATVKNSCIGRTKIHVTRQRFYLGRTAGYDPKWYKNKLNQANCVDEDPMFVDPEKHDYRLKPDSPCVNAGANEPQMEDAVDRDGKPRLRGDSVDIGAYEAQADKQDDKQKDKPADN